MAQLIKVTHEFDDGTETVHEFHPNENAPQIEAEVAQAVADNNGGGGGQEELQPEIVQDESVPEE